MNIYVKSLHYKEEGTPYGEVFAKCAYLIKMASNKNIVIVILSDGFDEEIKNKKCCRNLSAGIIKDFSKTLGKLKSKVTIATTFVEPMNLNKLEFLNTFNPIISTSVESNALRKLLEKIQR